MPRREILCDDWQCPAAASCALHFGRSKEYAAMNQPFWDGVIHTTKRAREAGAESCRDYVTDGPKRWLLSPVDQWQLYSFLWLVVWLSVRISPPPTPAAAQPPPRSRSRVASTRG